jgi:3-mercaptopyruvate sulfurtransferase SseA
MARVEKDWQDRVKRLLKAELTRRDISYRELAERLRAMGVDENERNISNKIVRGSFTAAFFFQCMAAIGCKTVHLDDD